MKTKLKRHEAPGTIELPIVPLVDVAMLLILFFILTSQVASAKFTALQVAEASQAGGKRSDEPNRIIINVLSRTNPHVEQDEPAVSSQVREYQVEGTPVPPGDPVDPLGRQIKARLGELRDLGHDPMETIIELRADKRVRYLDIQPVLQAASSVEYADARGQARKGLKSLQITALKTGNGGK